MPGQITLATIENVTTVLYHSPCCDGFGAAYCFWKVLGVGKGKHHVKYIGVSHSTPDEIVRAEIQSLKGKSVVFVDFCYKTHIMMEIYAVVENLLILDHHKTTIDDGINDTLRKHAVIDMKRSGAMIAWDFCFPETIRPRFLEYIGDRDLWKWAHDETDPFTSVFYNEVPFDFIEYEKYENDALVGKTIAKGKIVLGYEKKQIDQAVKYSSCVSFLSYNVMISNSSVHVSKIGNELAAMEGIDFAVIWHYDHKRDQIGVSLRSMPSTEDVTKIAKRFGGGGHRCASGFSWPGDSIQSLLKCDFCCSQPQPHKVGVSFRR